MAFDEGLHGRQQTCRHISPEADHAGFIDIRSCKRLVYGCDLTFKMCAHAPAQIAQHSTVPHIAAETSTKPIWSIQAAFPG